jgi:glycosyltransferase involved in cell wall biosynthesis
MVTAITGFHKISGLWEKGIHRYIILTSFSKNIFLNSSLSIAESQITIKPNFVADVGAAEMPRHDHYLFVGRISMEKGLEVLLKAFSNQTRTLYIIGDGPEKAALERLYQHQSNIRFLGSQSGEQVIEQLKTCRAMVFPSLWYEGLPFSIIEAFATGTPVIASKLGAMQELITHEYNGLLFKAGDAIQLNNCLDHFEEILNDDMYKNARQTYLQHYTAEKHYRSIMNIYNEVIEQTNGKYAGKE